MWRALALLLCSVASALAQTVSAPELLGTIAGPGAVHQPDGVRFYGTDLGWTFEHDGRHWMLFGDTWPHDRSMCEPLPLADDAQATLPLTLPESGLPILTIETDPDAPNEFARIRVLQDGRPAVMGYNKTPLTAFSEGDDAIGFFGEIDLVRCGSRRGKPSCKAFGGHLECRQDAGICAPEVLGYDAVCDLATNAGCIAGQQCQPTPTGLCVDPDSSQNDGTSASLPAMAAYHTHVAVQDETRPADWHEIGTFASNTFLNQTARTVRCFSGRVCGSDYAPGTGAALVWGRPGYEVLPGRQAHLYLMALELPLARTRDGRLRWKPRYFAGLGKNGDPIWTKHEARAEPLALDGVAGGSPDESHLFPNQMAMSWLGPPVRKWMMLYGGGGSGVSGAVGSEEAGPILARFADHPWGPWSRPSVALDPGGPTVVGSAFGPGGWIFHPECDDARCAASDPHRPVDYFVPGCPEVGKTLDTGILYAPNVIDAYTRAAGTGGLDVFWNVSAWNPYLVALLRTNVRPDPASPAPACGAGRRPKPRFRWCA